MNWLTIEGLTDPSTRWVVLGDLSILLATFLAVAVIIVATRKSTMSTMRHTLDAMRAVNAVPPSGASQSMFTTVGRGSVRWEPDSPILVLVTHFKAPSQAAAQEMADRKFDDLQQKLGEKGFDLRDIVRQDLTGHPEDDGYAASQAVCMSARSPSDKKDIEEHALAAGFRIDREAAIETVSLDDANREAGMRAIDEAVANLETIAARLDLPREGFGMIDVRLESIEVGQSVNGQRGEPVMVVRRAEIGWSRT